MMKTKRMYHIEGDGNAYNKLTGNIARAYATSET
jgi:hypothetical protein